MQKGDEGYYGVRKKTLRGCVSLNGINRVRTFAHFLDSSYIALEREMAHLAGKPD